MQSINNRNQLIRIFNKELGEKNYEYALSLVDHCAEVLGSGDREMLSARVLFSRGLFDETEKAIVEGLKIAPSHYGLYRLLGETMGELGEVDSAKRCLQGSRLDNYILEKYFAEESRTLKYADEAAAPPVFVYDEGAKELPNIVQLPDIEPRKEFSVHTLKSARPSVFMLEDGKVWFDGHNLCVYNQHDEMIGSCTMGNPLLVESIRHSMPLKRISGNLSVVVARSCDNYFHWTTDVAPGFHLIDKVCRDDEAENTHLVSHTAKQFQIDFMRLNNIDVERVITQGSENGCYFTADKLLVPVFRHRMAMGMGSWAVDYLRGIAANRADNTAVGKKRIYISRRDVKSRGVDNEDKLIELLALYGFEDIALDGLSVLQQMALFRDCEFVFAPHGAGLTNLIYCREGTKVVEFFSDFVQPCFRSLASLAKLEYGHFSVSEPVVNSSELAASKRKHVIQHENYAVSLSDVETILHAMGCGRLDTRHSA